MTTGSKKHKPTLASAGKRGTSSPTPAPGDLRLVQAFVNTAYPVGRSDELKSLRSLSEWLVKRDLLPAGVRLAEDDLRRARAARRGLHALLMANNGAKLDAEAVERLDQALVRARAQVRFDRDGSGRVVLRSQSFDEVLGSLMGLVLAAQHAGLWPRLKACASSTCRAAFFDYARNRTGRWCTRRCGDKIRSRAYRRAQKYPWGD